MIGIFYIPLWVSVFINFYLYMRVRNFLNNQYENSTLKSVIKKMIYYPLIFIIVGIFEAINIILFFCGINDFVFDVIDNFLMTSLGFWNCIVYLLTD